MKRLTGFFDNPSRNAAVLGGALLLLGLLLLGFTEHADRLRALGEDALGGFVLTGEAARPGPAADGHLVLAAGAPAVTQPARDAQFGVAVMAPALVRKVEMFQWNETRFGGPPAYEMNWYDHAIDSSAFAVPAGHANPGAFPIGGARFDSPGVSVGGFRLDVSLVDQIPGVEPYTPDLAHVPPNMAATFTAHAGTLVTSADPARPQIGDLRVSWQRIAPAELTVFARDAGGTLVPANDRTGDPVAQVMVGKLGLTDVLADAPQPPRFKWARRIVAVLLAWAGVALLLPRRFRRDRALTLAVAAVPLALGAAAFWFDVRMLAFVVLAVIAVLAAVTAVWRWKNRPPMET